MVRLTAVCRAACARQSSDRNGHRRHMRRIDGTPMYFRPSAQCYTFATFPAAAIRVTQAPSGGGKSGARDGSRRSVACRALHRRKWRIEATQSASKGIRDRLRHGRSPCPCDSSDDVVGRTARASGRLSSSCRSGDASVRSSCETFRNAPSVRDGRATMQAGMRAGWFEYCCSGRT